MTMMKGEEKKGDKEGYYKKCGVRKKLIRQCS